MATTYSPGRYRARVTEQGYTESSRGTPCYYLQVLILGTVASGVRANPTPQYERTLRWYPDDPRGVGFRILLDDLRRLGLESRDLDLTRLDPTHPDPITLAGQEIEVNCEIEAYEGRNTERWTLTRDRKRLSLAEIRTLAARIGAPTTSPPPPPDTGNSPNS